LIDSDSLDLFFQMEAAKAEVAEKGELSRSRIADVRSNSKIAARTVTVNPSRLMDSNGQKRTQVD
jgi:hypothetical protein